jgi:hypothetical protein
VFIVEANQLFIDGWVDKPSIVYCISLK